MNNYDDDYFVIAADDDNPRLPTIKPDKKTGERRFYYVPPATGSAPFVFTNGWKEEFKRDGVRDEVADILFHGTNFMVRSAIRERLLPLELPGLTMHPSIYIDDAGNPHDDFWFLTFHAEFDCWDRQQSRYLAYSPERSMVLDYSLDKAVLEATPLRQRLLFQMGGTLESRVLCHRSIAEIFREHEGNGAVLKAVRGHV